MALGSSSTAGAGARDGTESYPSRLAESLQASLPGEKVVVLNRGINGEETGQMLERMGRDALAENPDLVIWQVGSNEAVRRNDLAHFAQDLEQGITRLREAGVDIILMDLQFAPRVIESPIHKQVASLIDIVAHEHHVPVFHRFELMRQWSRNLGDGYPHILAADGLHMNGASYACLGQVLAHSLLDLAAMPGGRPPAEIPQTASAGALSVR